MKKKLLFFEPELFEELQKEAKEKHMTLCAYIRSILYERNK